MTGLDDRIHIAEMKEAIAEHSRHSFVHLYDDASRGLCSGKRSHHFDAEGEHPVTIRGGGHQQRRIDRRPSRSKQVRNLREMRRDVFGVSIEQRTSIRWPDEPGVMTNSTSSRWLRERVVAEQ